ncbi:sporulation histidine kinase inhibitor Sda [Halobacillus litoralis]|uniref:Sporulation histidine kinase inhibitor Sda n=1 Tax=Halobacillus litoralis TaxID=45668 RepID=A0A845DLS2_9BACI|nr:sporulation histidine kinase inhibitor Sda [Halobacillus litoralis]MYL18561.1 sporulation histidine kinase inhibitor Sda [Halobacillus litoralis]
MSKTPPRPMKSSDDNKKRFAHLNASSIKTLSDPLLLLTYRQAAEMGLDRDFLLLVCRELKDRGFSIECTSSYG